MKQLKILVFVTMAVLLGACGEAAAPVPTPEAETVVVEASDNVTSDETAVVGDVENGQKSFDIDSAGSSSSGGGSSSPRKAGPSPASTVSAARLGSSPSAAPASSDGELEGELEGELDGEPDPHPTTIMAHPMSSARSARDIGGLLDVDGDRGHGPTPASGRGRQCVGAQDVALPAPQPQAEVVGRPVLAAGSDPAACVDVSDDEHDPADPVTVIGADVGVVGRDLDAAIGDPARDRVPVLQPDERHDRPLVGGRVGRRWRRGRGGG